jgi:hypothetical protein
MAKVLTPPPAGTQAGSGGTWPRRGKVSPFPLRPSSRFESLTIRDREIERQNRVASTFPGEGRLKSLGLIFANGIINR